MLCPRESTTALPSMAEITQRLNPSDRKLRCPECCATADASCDCHVDYKWEPGERARRAIEADPGKSDMSPTNVSKSFFPKLRRPVSK
jgi:hypothetical protein